MDWIKIIILTVTLLYASLLLLSILINLGTKQEQPGLEKYTSETRVSIIIPARNEEENILKCLESIAQQDFSKNNLQVIVVDDHSTDKTVQLAESFLKANFTNYKLLALENSEKGKKTAITKAIGQATGSIIITRDADTYTQSNLWLKSIVHHFDNKNCDLLISPLILSSNNSLVSTFQQLENLAINSIGPALTKVKMPFVCSGANLAYKKESFLKTDPYKDNLHIASGDDMFLLQHFYRDHYKIEANTYPQAVVYSPTEKTLAKMLSQRLRWAAKSGKTSTPPIVGIGLLVLIMNTLSLPILFLGLVCGFYFTFGLFTLTLKFIIDFLLLFLSARMYKQKVNWLWYPLAFLFNGLYVPALSLTSIFVKPSWKLRKP